MFTPLEEKQIQKFNHQLSKHITIDLAVSANTASKPFKAFCDELTRMVPGIQVKREEASTDDPPQIILGGNLRYQAVPTGHELQPFLDTLAALDSDDFKISDPAARTRLKKNKFPADLTVFIAPQCAFCPQVVQRLIALALTDKRIQLTIIDGSLFPESLLSHDIKAVPTILLDDQFRWTGSIPLEEIIDAITTRDPASLGAVSLESILKDGGADRLAAMMLESKKLFPALYDVLTHAKWPTRLGAMVVMEEIAEKNPELAAEGLNPLWDRFQYASAQIQGDILHVFGEIGNPRAVPWLRTVLAGEFSSEVKEAAQDALSVLSNKKPCHDNDRVFY